MVGDVLGANKLAWLIALILEKQITQVARKYMEFDISIVISKRWSLMDFPSLGWRTALE